MARKSKHVCFLRTLRPNISTCKCQACAIHNALALLPPFPRISTPAPFGKDQDRSVDHCMNACFTFKLTFLSTVRIFLWKVSRRTFTCGFPRDKSTLHVRGCTKRLSPSCVYTYTFIYEAHSCTEFQYS